MKYSVRHFVPPRFYSSIHKYEFCCDLPIPTKYKDLDNKYKGSKFIYTVRDIDSWIESCRKHWSRKPTPKNNYRSEYRLAMYNTIEFNEQKLRDAYAKHHLDVMEYFKDRPDDLLTMNIMDGDGWDQLIPFLTKDDTKILKQEKKFPWKK
jgi:hypothetical protein